jgi:hypothetical protein
MARADKEENEKTARPRTSLGYVPNVPSGPDGMHPDEYKALKEAGLYEGVAEHADAALLRWQKKNDPDRAEKTMARIEAREAKEAKAEAAASETAASDVATNKGKED